MRRSVFKNVYDNNFWGRAPDGRRFYSDSPPNATAPLRRLVEAFIRDHDIHRIIDLGCGDGEFASGVDIGDAYYIGVDLYDELIQWNRTLLGGEKRVFVVADIVEDELPPGDMCMIHMVLYLLSYEDIFKILEKLRQYRYVLVTDGQPQIPPEERRNIDKPTSGFTRFNHFTSGFYLELPPFELPVRTLLEYTLPSGEIMRTVLLEHPMDAP